MKHPLKIVGISALVLFAAILFSASLPIVPSGTWVAVAPMNSARIGASTVLLQDGRILVTGGSDANGPTNTAEFFGANASFSPATPMNAPRSGHVAVVLQDGRVLVAGGTTSGGGITNSAEIFDPATTAWTNVTGGMIEARAGYTATLLKDGRVLLTGGAGSSGTISLTAEIFDPAAQTFTLAGQLSSARKSHAAALLSDGRVLIVGGLDGANVLGTSDIYDPTAGTISAGPNLSVARQGLTATTLLDGRVLIAGGNHVIVNPDGSSSPADLASAEILDAGATAFSPTASALLTARSGHQAFLLPNNNSVLIVGGTTNGVAIASAELFIPWGGNSQTGVFRSTGLMSTPRSSATGSALHQDGLLLIAGGQDASGAPLASSELYGFATVKTDAADYPPGTTVYITGAGWQPGEAVALTLVESPLIDTHGPYTVTADANGNISDSSFTTDFHDLDVHFNLTATGSVSQAQTMFSDGNAKNVTVASPTSATVGSGATATYGMVTISFNGTFNSMNPSCTVALGATGLPPGASPVFGANSLKSTGSPVTTSFSISTSTSAPIGTYNTIEVTATNGADCQNNADITTSNNVTLVVTPPAATSTGITAPAITYGANGSVTVTVSATSTPTGTVTLSVDSGAPASKALSGGAATFTSTDIAALITPGAGSHSLSASYAAQNGFAASSSTGSLTVSQAALTISVTAAGTTYTGLPYAGLTTCSALGVNGEHPTATPSYQDASHNPLGSAPTNAGSYFLQCSAGGTGTNYVAKSSTAGFTIGQAHPTLTTSGGAFTYDGLAHASVGSAKGVDGTTNVPGSFVYTYTPGGVTAPTSASATPYGVSAAFTSTDSNYDNGTAPATSTITINKAHPTLTTSGGTFTYDGLAHASVGSAKGVDGTTNVAGSFVYTYTPGGVTAPTSASATPYGVSAAFTSTDSNYDNGTAPATSTITINKAHPTLTTSGGTFTYDGLAHASVGSAKGVDGTTNVTGSFVYTYTPGGSTAPMNASATPYGVSAAFTSTDSNYDNGTAPATSTITINKAHPTLTTSGGTFTYDGLAHASVGSAKGVDGTTNVAGSFVYTYTPGGVTAPTSASATPYGVSAAFTSTDSNYDNGTAPATSTITINKAHPTLTTSGGTFTYDGLAHASVGSAKGVDGTTNVAGSFVYTYTPGGVTAPTNASATPYGVSAAFTSTDSNYDNGTAPATSTITINQAHPTLTTSGGTFTYDGLAHASVGSAKGVDGTTNVAGSFVYTYTPGGVTAPTNASATPYGVSAAFTSTDSNYDNGTAPATNTITINKAHPTLTTSGGTFTYDGLAHASVGSAKGVDGTTNVAGSFVYTYTPGGSTAPTNASATPYGVSAAFTSTDSNYDNGTAPATSTITINKAHPTLTTSGGTFTYDGLAHASVGSAKGVDGTTNVAGSFVYTYTPGGSTAPTSASATPYGVSAAFTSTDSNYDNGTAPATSTITINKAHPTLTTSGGTFTYDGLAHASVGSAKGVDGTTNVAGSFVYTYTPGGVTAPTSASATPYGVSAAFTSTDSNYDNGTAPATSTITINKAHPTLTTSGGTFTYDGLAHASVGSAKGVDGTTNVAGSFVYTYTPGGVTAPTNASATPYGVSAAFTSTDSNYDNGTAPATSTITINKAHPTLTTSGGTFTYDGLAHASVGSAKGVDGTTNVAGSFVYTYTPGGVTAPTNASATPYGVSAAFTSTDSNYDNGTAPATNTITINKAHPTLTTSGGTFTYDGLAHASVGSAKGVDGTTNVAGSFVYTYTPGGVTAPTNASATPYGVSAAFTSTDSNYDNGTAPATNTITINKAHPTLTTSGGTFTYDGLAHASVGSAKGVDGTTNVTGSFVYTYTPGGSAAPTNASATPYGVSAAFTSADSNYDNGTAPATSTITINKAHPTLTTSGGTFTYDGLVHASVGSAKGVDGTTNVTGSFVYTYTPGGVTAPMNASATPYGVSAAFTSADSNYDNGTAPATNTITINKAHPTLTTSGGTFTYDGLAHASVGSAKGVDGTTNVTGSFVYTYTPGGSAAPTNASATPYGVSAAFTSADSNYDNGTAPATSTITINQARPTLTTSGGTFTYDGMAHASVGSAKGVDGTTNVAGSFVYTYTPGGSTAPINASATPYGVSAAFTSTDSNYDNGTAPATSTITINQARPTLTTSGGTFTYDGMAHASVGSAKGVDGTTNVAGSFVYTYTPGGSTAPINASATPYGVSAAFTSTDSNYDNGTAPATSTITINQASSTTAVTFEPGPYTYRATAFTATAAVSGVGGLNQAATVLYSGDCTNVSTANGCTATATFAGDTNHTGSSDAKSITIMKADAMVNITPYSGIYDGNPHSLTGSATGVGGVNLSASLNFGASFTNVPGGTATWTFTGGTNYNNQTSTAGVTITQASSTTAVSFEPGPYTYRATAFTATAAVSGVGGLNQAATVLYSGDCTNVSTANGCTATATFAGDTNHTGSSDAKGITIVKADATVNITPYSGIYDGNPHSLTGSATGVGGVNLSSSLNFGTSFTNVPGGTATWTFTGGTNYNNQTSTAAVTITQATSSVTLTCPATPQTYAGSPQIPCTASYSTSDGLSGPLSVIYTNNVNAGTAGATANYAGDINHAGSDKSGSFTINARNATWTTTVSSKTYGDLDPNPLTTGSGTNFIAADGVSATYSRAAGETVSSGPYHIAATLAPAAALSNYNITNTGASFTITRANTITSVISSTPNPLVYDQPITIYAGVSNASTSAAVSEGMVVFTADPAMTPLCTTTTVIGGMASCTTGSLSLAVGGHTITSTYIPGPDFVGSGSVSVDQAVNARHTSVAITSTEIPNFATGSISINTPVHIQVTVTDDDPAGTPITPTGTFPITDLIASDVFSPASGGNGLCVLSGIGASASCSLTVTPVEADLHELTVGYPGDAVHLPATQNADMTVTAPLVSQKTCLSAPFNGTAIPAGSTVWFNAVFQTTGQKINALTHLSFYNQTIQIGGNGTPMHVPDGVIKFDPNATFASTTFDAANNRWNTTLPTYNLAGKNWLSGMPVQLPSGLAAGTAPITWCGQFASDDASLQLGWQWAAAVYSANSGFTYFDPNNPGDLNYIGVKAVDDNKADINYKSSDHAGTPENFLKFVIGGARGGGGGNYTGGYSGTGKLN